MFLTNKYSKIYFSIIERSKLREIPLIVEKHHVIPVSLGGSNDKNNISKLTPKEHFICHRLLVKMTEGENKRKMSYAIWAMCRYSSKHKRVVRSHQYDYAKRLLKELGETKVVTEETKQKLSKSLKGRKAPWLAKVNKSIPKSEKYKNGNLKVWSVTTPAGETLEIENLCQFCKEHNLSMGNLTAAGKTKGYTAKLLGTYKELKVRNT